MYGAPPPRRVRFAHRVYSTYCDVQRSVLTVRTIGVRDLYKRYLFVYIIQYAGSQYISQTQYSTDYCVVMGGV